MGEVHLLLDNSIAIQYMESAHISKVLLPSLMPIRGLFFVNHMVALRILVL